MPILLIVLGAAGLILLLSKSSLTTQGQGAVPPVVKPVVPADTTMADVTKVISGVVGLGTATVGVLSATGIIGGGTAVAGTTAAATTAAGTAAAGTSAAGAEAATDAAIVTGSVAGSVATAAVVVVVFVAIAVLITVSALVLQERTARWKEWTSNTVDNLAFGIWGFMQATMDNFKDSYNAYQLAHPPVATVSTSQMVYALARPGIGGRTTFVQNPTLTPQIQMSSFEYDNINDAPGVPDAVSEGYRKTYGTYNWYKDIKQFTQSPLTNADVTQLVNIFTYCAIVEASAKNNALYKFYVTRGYSPLDVERQNLAKSESTFWGKVVPAYLTSPIWRDPYMNFGASLDNWTSFNALEAAVKQWLGDGWSKLHDQYNFYGFSLAISQAATDGFGDFVTWPGDMPYTQQVMQRCGLPLWPTYMGYSTFDPTRPIPWAQDPATGVSISPVLCREQNNQVVCKMP